MISPRHRLANSPSEMSDLGGHFTSALLSQGFTAVADTDRDGFLSWQEAFETSVALTKKLYLETVFDADQETQEPLAYSLPTRRDMRMR